MKKLTVIAAGLGWNMLKRRNAQNIAGIRFSPRPSVFPAVTCPAQASLRTGKAPLEHGMLSNGVWFEDLQKPSFWEQSAKLVKGERIWGESTGLFFFQQSLGEKADVIVSPAPIHKHGGGMIMSCYTKPSALAQILEEKASKFKLFRYWGPLASSKIGHQCIDYFEAAIEYRDVDEAYLYLPTLDYAAQAYGPDSRQDLAAFEDFKRQLERVATFCRARGAKLVVTGDYEITPATMPPCHPNFTLRQAGLFTTRKIGKMQYPDFYSSKAFAICDHEICLLVGEEKEMAKQILLSSGNYDKAPEGYDDILLAKKGGWCEYSWWSKSCEAPDWASHVDIHNKPGFDPKELFLFCRGNVKGTHGRPCEVAYGET